MNDISTYVNMCKLLLTEVANWKQFVTDEADYASTCSSFERKWLFQVNNDPAWPRHLNDACYAFDACLERWEERTELPRDKQCLWALSVMEERGIQLRSGYEAIVVDALSILGAFWQIHLRVNSQNTLNVELSAQARDIVQVLRTVLSGLKKWRQDDSDTRDRRERDCIDGYRDYQMRLLRIQRDHVDTVNHDAWKQAKWLPVAQYLLREVLSRFEDALELAWPKPGPGSVAEKYTPLQKWGHLWQHDSYRFNVYMDPRNRDRSIRVDSENPVEQLSTCRLRAVPKTRWKDRIITIEPNGPAMAQQMCRTAMLSCIAEHPLTRHLDLNDQGRQQVAAQEGSSARLGFTSQMRGVSVLWDQAATLDFSEASDRITFEHVRCLFPEHVTRYLFACRSFYAEHELLGGEPLAIMSYAGMGNATTFVVETLVYWAVTLAVLLCFRDPLNAAILGASMDPLSTGRMLTFEDLAKPAKKGLLAYSRKVRAYGDDIIIPSDLAVMSNLFEVYQSLDWKLNMAKSYYLIGGQFRESCGVHAFYGQDVTPIYFEGWADDLQGRVAVADKLREVRRELDQGNFLWKLAFEHLYESAASVSNTHLLHRDAYAFNGMAIVSFPEFPERNPCSTRWNPDLCRLEVYTAVNVAKHERCKRGFSELLLASLLGYHYGVQRFVYVPMWAKQPNGRRQRILVRRTTLQYSAPLPRDVISEEGWYPTSPWGLDRDQVSLPSLRVWWTAEMPDAIRVDLLGVSVRVESTRRANWSVYG